MAMGVTAVLLSMVVLVLVPLPGTAAARACRFAAAAARAVIPQSSSILGAASVVCLCLRGRQISA
jgi:hypothetical protein